MTNEEKIREMELDLAFLKGKITALENRPLPLQAGYYPWPISPYAPPYWPYYNPTWTISGSSSHPSGLTATSGYLTGNLTGTSNGLTTTNFAGNLNGGGGLI